MSNHLPASVNDGWFALARACPSPNFDQRPAQGIIDMVIIHNISLPPCQFGGHDIEALFTNQLDCTAHPFYAGLQNVHVASHFLIRRDGEVIQFVSCNHRAWHAGLSRWQGRERCNDFSIGIELEGSDYTAFTDAQYAALQTTLVSLGDHYPLQTIVGHSDIAPERKSDPGPFFDWRRLSAALPQQLRNYMI